MKKAAYFLLTLCLASCTEAAVETFRLPDTVFHVNLDGDDDAGTKVYLNKQVKTRWNADDRLTVFNKFTYNQQYVFTGETGDCAGDVEPVNTGGFVTGNEIGYVYAVYPYLKTTKISNSEVLTVYFPAEQAYAKGTYGRDANVMVSVTDDDNLLFKNAGGYLMLKLFGEGVEVSSVMLEGNGGEPLSGKSSIVMSKGGVPAVTMASTAGTSVTLACETPVALGATAEEAVVFWLVVPPTDFKEGFRLTVSDAEGRTFVKETSKSFSIVRNGVLRISPVEVVF